MVEIFDTALNVLIMIFVVVIIYLVGVNLISANIHPMIVSLKPTNNTTGISQTMYEEKADRIKEGFYWVFYILLAIPFVYLIVKLLYEKEETSVYGGVYQ